MPELPEVEALAHHLREYALGRRITRIDVASLAVLKTVDPPLPALQGATVTGASRHGKFLAVRCDRPGAGELHLVTHLARAGWLRWSAPSASVP